MEDTSFTLTLSGESSVLESYYFPPIDLSPQKKYVLGLIELLTFNAIPNIDTNCNKVVIGEQIIVLPTGSYEITDINSYIKTQLESKDISFSLTANNNTLQSIVTSSHSVDFRPQDSIAKLLGFSHSLLDPEKTHTSSVPVRILKFNVLRVECNITGGAYINNKKVHTIHEFFPAVPPGFKIIEIPSKVIYQPIVVKSINYIRLKIVDENGDLVNFRGETITIRLHIKAIN
jgi:hypothetical protein